jgi:hypothetical protein
MRALASLSSELQVTGVALPAIGLVGLVGGAATADTVVRAVVPFVLVAALLAAVQFFVGFRWYQRTIAAAAPAPEGSDYEPPADTRTRVLKTLVIYVVLVGGAILTGRGLGAVIGGVVFGVGVIDLYTSRWLMRRDASEAQPVFRETSKGLFASGRRPLYLGN